MWWHQHWQVLRAQRVSERPTDCPAPQRGLYYLYQEPGSQWARQYGAGHQRRREGGYSGLLHVCLPCACRSAQLRQGISAIFARGGMRIILYIIAVPFNVFAIYWLITETDFQAHRHFKWKLFLGAFIPVFSVILLAAPTRWRESIPLGILTGILIGYRWSSAEPRRIAEIRKKAETVDARKTPSDH